MRFRRPGEPALGRRPFFAAGGGRRGGAARWREKVRARAHFFSSATKKNLLREENFCRGERSASETQLGCQRTNEVKICSGERERKEEREIEAL